MQRPRSRVLALAMAVTLTGAACGQEKGPQAVVETTTATTTTTTTTAPPPPPPAETTTTPPTTTAAPAKVTPGEFRTRVELTVAGPDGEPAQLFGASTVAVSESGIIAIGTDDGGIYMFSSNGELRAKDDTIHDGKRVAALAFIGDTDRLISGAGDGTINLWPAPTAATTLSPPVQSTAIGSTELTAIASSKQGGWIAIAGINGQVGVTRFGESGPGTVQPGFQIEGWATSLAFSDSADGPPTLAIGTSDGAVMTADPSSADAPTVLAQPIAEPISSLTYVDNSSSILAGGSTTPLMIDAKTGDEQPTVDAPESGTAGGSAVSAVAAWQPAGSNVTRVATASSDAASDATVDPIFNVRLWTTDGAEPGLPTRFTEEVTGLAFLPNGDGLVIVNDQGAVVRFIE